MNMGIYYIGIIFSFLLAKKRFKPYPRDPSIQIIPTLGPKACKYYLHWAIWIPRDRIMRVSLTNGVL